MSYLILDLASTSIQDVEQYCDEPTAAPSNWKDEAKIAAYIAEKQAERVASAALDIDLARITAVGLLKPGGEPVVYRCPDQREEVRALSAIRIALDDGMRLVTFNGLRYDLPLVLRRSMYLDLPRPMLDIDRYRSPHVDVFELLTHRGAIKAHSLTWYAKRFGWTDLMKPLSGAEEAKAAQDGRWDELEASVIHDLRACERLAMALGVVERQPEPVL
jgi:hypothetical protein